MPARAPNMTTIGYIGVVPSQRGRRYVDDLLARGTAVLRHDVPDIVIRADTDLANEPMAAAFERSSVGSEPIFRPGFEGLENSV